jgi:hypothetical protein
MPSLQALGVVVAVLGASVRGLADLETNDLFKVLVLSTTKGISLTVGPVYPIPPHWPQ